MQQKRNPLQDLQPAKQCANAANKLLGIEAVSGDALKQAHKRKDKLGMSPPCSDHNSILPEDDFLKDLASLMQTMLSLEQVTAEPRLD